MQVANAQQPSARQQAAAAERDDGRPVYMLNLLKFRERAVYADGRETALSGREAYALYGRAMSRLVAEAGGSLVFAGNVRGVLVGEIEAGWDAVGVMMYPSFAAMAAITASPEYAAIHVHRDAGLEGQVLIETVKG